MRALCTLFTQRRFGSDLNLWFILTDVHLASLLWVYNNNILLAWLMVNLRLQNDYSTEHLFCKPQEFVSLGKDMRMRQKR